MFCTDCDPAKQFPDRFWSSVHIGSGQTNGDCPDGRRLRAGGSCFFPACPLTCEFLEVLTKTEQKAGSGSWQAAGGKQLRAGPLAIVAKMLTHLGFTHASGLGGGGVYIFFQGFIFCSLTADNLATAADISKNDSYLQGEENGKY